MHVWKSIYKGSTLAILTQHGKKKVIAPVQTSAIDCHVALATGFDTDRLGTFTRDIPRARNSMRQGKSRASVWNWRICLWASPAKAGLGRTRSPEYGLAVHPQNEDDPRIRKGITDWETRYSSGG